MWTEIYNTFDPSGVRNPENLKQWYVSRPGDFRAILAKHFSPSGISRPVLFGGHPSSGKTTELFSFLNDLHELGYFPIYISLDLNLSNIQQANHLEVLFLIGATVFKAAQDANLKPDRKRMESLLNELQTVVHTHTENKSFKLDLDSILKSLSFIAGSFLPGGVATGALTSKTVENIRPFGFVSGTNIDTVKKLEVQPEIESMVETLNLLLDDIKAKCKSPLALLVDGLDKVAPSVDEVLFTKPYLSRLNCHVAFAAPPTVFYSTKFSGTRNWFEVMPFPNIRLNHRDRNDIDASGWAMLREVVWKRLRTLRHDPETIIKQVTLDVLIAGSSGLMRELISLMRSATVYADIAKRNFVDEIDAKKAVASLRRDFEARLRPNTRAVLAQVKQTQQLSDDRLCDELLFGNYILGFVNDDVWFDVHRVLLDRV